MSDAAFSFENHFEAIKEILSQNKVDANKRMRLLGNYLSVSEARVFLGMEKSRQKRERIRNFIMMSLDLITEMVGALGEELEDGEFEKLLVHTSAVHGWMSSEPQN